MVLGMMKEFLSEIKYCNFWALDILMRYNLINTQGFGGKIKEICRGNE